MQAPLINGHYYSFQDIEMVIAPSLRPPITTSGFKAINYDDNLTKAKVRGAASVPLGMTKGRYEAKADVEFYLPAAVALLRIMGPGWRALPVTFTVAYVVQDLSAGLSLDAFLTPTTDVFTGYLTELTASQAEGEEPLARKFGITLPGQILWNGVPSIIESGLLGVLV